MFKHCSPLLVSWTLRYDVNAVNPKCFGVIIEVISEIDNSFASVSLLLICDPSSRLLLLQSEETRYPGIPFVPQKKIHLRQNIQYLICLFEALFVAVLSLLDGGDA